MTDASRTADAAIDLLAPLSGWVMPLEEVPDSVFASGLAGWGVAIDPTSETLRAPCHGIVRLAGGNLHALSLSSAAGELLLHVGIDTVQLRGQGFALHVAQGQQVSAGQPLLDFDLSAIVRGASSAITPVLVGGAPASAILQQAVGRAVRAGDFLMRVAGAAGTEAALSATAAQPAEQRHYRVTAEHGLHARPAARLAAALQGLDALVELRAHGRTANARSPVGLMALGLRTGDDVMALVSGPDADAVWRVLDSQLQPEAGVAVGFSASTGPSMGSITGSANAPALITPAPTPGAGDSFAGVVASHGLAMGVAVRLDTVLPVDTPRDGQPPAIEEARLDSAIAAVAARLAKLAEGQGAEAEGLLAAHLALLADPELLSQARRRISAGESAGMAWSAVLSASSATLAALDDSRMAERRADLLDIELQVRRALAGEPVDVFAELPEGAIALAHELLPSQFLALDPAKLAGVATVAGGASSHVAILAAARGLPMLVGVGDALLAIADRTPLLLDAEAGRVVVDPPASQREQHALRSAKRRQRLKADEAAALQPAVTRDGVAIDVWCNLGKLAEAAPAVAAGAGGCGLLRTEFLFLDRRLAPDVAEQLSEYQGIATALEGRPLTIRTLDAGGDKPLPFISQPREENPALGLRGVRGSLAHPDLLEIQLEAVLGVEPAGQCRLLLPMVTDLGDVRAVRALLDSIARRLGRQAPALGVMVETPAAALLADQLCREVDFLSIGSNDLTQYTLAMDRQHPVLAARLDGLHPSVLRLIAQVAAAAKHAGKEAGLCGGLASDPLAVPLLLGLGLTELSVAPSMVASIKGQVRRLSLGECREMAAAALQLTEASAVRAQVRAWLGEE